MSPTASSELLSLRYPEYLMLGGSPVYIFTASVLVGLHDDRPTPLAGSVHTRAIAEAMHNEHDAVNIHPNGIDAASGAFRFSFIGDREGRIFGTPPELFMTSSQAAQNSGASDELFSEFVAFNPAVVHIEEARRLAELPFTYSRSCRRSSSGVIHFSDRWIIR